MLGYAQESSWRRITAVSNGNQVSGVTALALKRGKSMDFTTGIGSGTLRDGRRRQICASERARVAPIAD